MIISNLGGNTFEQETFSILNLAFFSRQFSYKVKFSARDELTWTITSQDSALDEARGHGNPVKQNLILGALAVPGASH